MKNSARGDSSTGSELKAVEQACREASRTVEPCELRASVVKYRLLFLSLAVLSIPSDILSATSSISADQIGLQL